MKGKQPVTTYLDSELIRLLGLYGNRNRLDSTQSIESILRIFFATDDAIHSLVVVDDLQQRMNVFENRLLTPFPL